MLRAQGRRCLVCVSGVRDGHRCRGPAWSCSPRPESWALEGPLSWEPHLGSFRRKEEKGRLRAPRRLSLHVAESNGPRKGASSTPEPPCAELPIHPRTPIPVDTCKSGGGGRGKGWAAFRRQAHAEPWRRSLSARSSLLRDVRPALGSPGRREDLSLALVIFRDPDSSVQFPAISESTGSRNGWGSEGRAAQPCSSLELWGPAENHASLGSDPREPPGAQEVCPENHRLLKKGRGQG